jgi:hypothetical protein
VKFRLKTIIDAIQFTGNNVTEIIRDLPVTLKAGGADGAFIIEAPDGRLIAHPGDWIVRNRADKYDIWTNDIFQATYEAVE